MRLERLHRLDHQDPAHLWLLHTIFLDHINNDCDDFRDEWNHHPISGVEQDQTPTVCYQPDLFIKRRFTRKLEHPSDERIEKR
jgi:hypothetical protein